jgi:hypothetical protein
MMDRDTITWTGARTPGVCGNTSWRCAVEPRRPDTVRCHRRGHEARGRMQTKRWTAHAGSRLKLDAVLGRPRLKGQPSSRTGENSPYGMRGGIEETSASFEARSAPRSYPAWALCAPMLHLLTTGNGTDRRTAVHGQHRCYRGSSRRWWPCGRWAGEAKRR